MREWEEESAAKKQANDENRARLDDMRHRRPSTPPRDAYRRTSPEGRRTEETRRADEQRRLDEQRHSNDGYHPSEAAHHPVNHTVSPQAPHPPAAEKAHSTPTIKDERPVPSEPSSATRSVPPNSEPERAARKVELDENYDDSGEDEKKGAALTNGSAAGSAEGKSSTPTSASVNGASGGAAKAD